MRRGKSPRTVCKSCERRCKSAFLVYRSALRACKSALRWYKSALRGCRSAPRWYKSALRGCRSARRGCRSAFRRVLPAIHGANLANRTTPSGVTPGTSSHWDDGWSWPRGASAFREVTTLAHMIGSTIRECRFPRHERERFGDRVR